MASLGSGKWLLVLGFVALLHAVNVSGLVCHACAHNTATGLNADCGRGRPRSCNSDADVREGREAVKQSALKSTYQTRQGAAAAGDTGYLCLTTVLLSGGATFTTRLCIKASAKEQELAECSRLGYLSCTVCDADLRDGKACNSGENPKTDTESEFNCHMCTSTYSSAGEPTDTCGHEPPKPCNLGGVIATNADLSNLQFESGIEQRQGPAASASPNFMCFKGVQKKDGVTRILRGCVNSQPEVERICSAHCYECSFCRNKTTACNVGDIPSTGVAEKPECQSSQQSSSAHLRCGLKAVAVLIGTISLMGPLQ